MAKRKQAKPVPVVKADGWSNLITKTNYTTRDKRTGAAIEPANLSRDDEKMLYRHNAIAARIVDLLPVEATREGYDIRVEEDEDMSEELEREHRRLKVSETVLQALKWQRAFGGAVILLGANDVELDLSKPLNEANIQTVESLTVFEPSECSVSQWQNDPMKPDFGAPEFFQIYPKVMGVGASKVLNKVHRSRIVWLPGAITDRMRMVEKRGFGDSVLERCWFALRDFGLSWDAASILIQDFSQAVFKIQGLAQALASDKEGLITARMAAMDMSRHVLRAIILDAGEAGGEGGEEFERKPTPTTGLPELLDKLSLFLAANAGVPVALLMGQPPSGLQSTGDADIQFWYNNVKTYQESDVKKALTRITEVMCLAKKGPAKGVVPEFCIEFRPLWQPTEKEKAETRQLVAQTDVAYLTAGVLTEDEVRRSRFGGDKYSMETTAEGDLMPSQTVDLGAEDSTKED